jgi:spore coat polysaccharide biosynthesis protein SpsF
MKMQISAIVQARCSSTRLPNKILKELPMNSGINVLQHVIRRLKHSKKLSSIVIATSTEPEDDIIKTIAEREKVFWYKGDLNDLVSRFYHCALKYKIDVIVRITSDCPCIDPEIVDAVIDKHLEMKSDYTSNTLERTFPHGLDVEVFNFHILERIYKEATKNWEREHVTPYIYKTKPEEFKIMNYRANKMLYNPDIRITLDTEEDYIILCAVYDYLYSKNYLFKTRDLITLFTKHPWLKLITKKITQKKVNLSNEEELDEAIRLLNLQGLNRAKNILENLKKK